MTGIGLLGFGTVGQGIYRILEERKETLTASPGGACQVKRILVQDIMKKRDTEVPEGLLTMNPEDILADESIRIVVEVTGDLAFSYDFFLKAFEKGKHVVTANKAVVSRHYEELSRKAEEHHVYFLYEASVAAGVPVIKALKDQIRLSSVNQVSGILNGTCNFILTKMSEENLGYEEALQEAQHLGYAESDPTADVAGTDTLRKLRILSTLAFGGSVLEKDILCEGISSITALDVRLLKSLGRKVKLLGEAKVEHGDFTAWVYPRAVSDKSSFYRVEGVDNSIQLDSSNGGNLSFQGPGAGMRTTASGVLTDVLDCILHTQRKESPLGEKRLQNRNELLEGTFYVRLGRDEEAESFPIEYVSKRLYDQDGVTCFLTEKMKLKKLRSLVKMQGNESFVIIAIA